MYGYDTLVRPATVCLNRATRVRANAALDFGETKHLRPRAAATIRRATKRRARHANRGAGKAFCGIGYVDHLYVPEYDWYEDDNVFEPAEGG